MIKPKFFVSTTFSSANEITSQVEKLILEYNFEPATFKKNELNYNLTKNFERSCYELIVESSFFILLIEKEKDSASQSIQTKQLIHQFTEFEYNIAKKIGIPIFVFIHEEAYNEFTQYEKSDEKDKVELKNIGSSNLARFISSISQSKPHIYLFKYEKFIDIESELKRQWNGLFHKYLRDAKSQNKASNEKVLVNPFKLFFFRRLADVKLSKLASVINVTVNKIQKLEDSGVKRKSNFQYKFKSIKLEQLQKIAKELQCSVSNLRGGLPDDFIAQYVSYYFKYKKAHDQIEATSKNLFKPKAVVFDFDGTLTKSDNQHTTWEEIWLELGFDINVCAELHKQFSSSIITHKQWCQLTCAMFKQKGLSKEILNKVVSRITLHAGCEDLLNELQRNNIKVYICSGSIDYIIFNVLKGLRSKFADIKCNKFKFENDMIHSIVGTKYDFEGKAHFISQVARKLKIGPDEILFVGNSSNDEFACQSRARTMCINPSMTNHENKYLWTECIRNLVDLKQILEFIDIQRK